jgi:hypothetical protein
MLCGQFDYIPLRGQPFAATLGVLCVGDMVVQHATTAAHVARGGIARGMAVLVLNVQGTHRVARVNGAEVGATEAVLAIGGAERTGCSPRRLDWGALAMPLPMLEEFAAALTAEAGHRPRPRAVGQALQYIVAAEAVMEARLERPVSTEDLCAALGVPARRLHDAFRAAVDMSPHAS